MLLLATGPLVGCGGAEFEIDGTGVPDGSGGSRPSESDSAISDGKAGESGDVGSDSPGLDAFDKDSHLDVGRDGTTAEGGDAMPISDRVSDVDGRDAVTDTGFLVDSDTPLLDAPTDSDSSPPLDGPKDAKNDTSSDTSTDTTLDAFDTGVRDVGCAEPVTYYRDKDGDGAGDNSDQQTGCLPPFGGNWVLIGGDCRDDLPEVKPLLPGDQNPPVHTGLGYADSSKPQGISFDYDCSGSEEFDPTNTYATEPDCGLLCSGVGYIAVNPPRSGMGINSYCGSISVKRCKGVAVCSSTIEDAAPYRCR